MHNLQPLIGQIAGLLSLAAFVPYVASTLKGKTKPNRASWWIWTLVGALLTASYYSSGARETIWVPIGYVVGPLIIALLSLRSGVGGATSVDRFSLVGAGLGVVLWAVFRQPIAALLINIVIAAFGALPTIRKAFKNPETEDRLAWAIFLAADGLNLFAIERWTFAVAVYPLYLVAVSGTMTALLVWRRTVSRDSRRPL